MLLLDRLQIGAQGGAARAEELALGLELVPDQRVGGGLLEIGVEADRRRCRPARPAGGPASARSAEVALAHGLVVGARDRLVELDQGLSLLDQIALPDQHAA